MSKKQQQIEYFLWGQIIGRDLKPIKLEVGTYAKCLRAKKIRDKEGYSCFICPIGQAGNMLKN